MKISTIFASFAKLPSETLQLLKEMELRKLSTELTALKYKFKTIMIRNVMFDST